jgi:hypothetical protein
MSEVLIFIIHFSMILEAILAIATLTAENNIRTEPEHILSQVRT